jgi:hypothetical protein
MPVTTEKVHLNAEQIKDLNQKLATMRHDINNALSLMLAATELIRHKPQMAEKMLETLGEQPAKITESIARFSNEFESTCGIKRA